MFDMAIRLNPNNYNLYFQKGKKNFKKKVIPFIDKINMNNL